MTPHGSDHLSQPPQRESGEVPTELDRASSERYFDRIRRKRTSKLEVDHTVADAWRECLVDTQVKVKQATYSGADEEKKLILPDSFESRDDAAAFISMLGNCSLLDKSFNIAKTDESMRHFLHQVHDFKDNKKK